MISERLAAECVITSRVCVCGPLGGDASALEPTCKQQQPYRLSMAWVACIAVSCVLVLGVVLAIGIWYCVRHNGRSVLVVMVRKSTMLTHTPRFCSWNEVRLFSDHKSGVMNARRLASFIQLLCTTSLQTLQTKIVMYDNAPRPSVSISSTLNSVL